MSTESIDPRYANYQRADELQQRLIKINTLSGECKNQQYRVAVVKGRWHQYIVDRLLEGALNTLNECGIDDVSIDIVEAPGAYEMPLICKVLAEKKQYKAVITLGAIIKGETPHFEYVAGECAKGLAEVSRQYNLPIGFGVLTVNNVDQAMARAAEGESNKGREAVLAAIEVADLIAGLDK